MNRFFVEEKAINNGIISIEGSDAHHIAQVLRFKVGQIICVVCAGLVFETETIFITKNRVEAKIISQKPGINEPDLDVYLLQGIAKGDKMDLIIQKSVELGVHAIVPVAFERSVVQLAGEKATKKQARWQQISAEAAKQCGRDKIPQVYPVCNLQEALQIPPRDAFLLMPWEEEKNTGLRAVLPQISPKSLGIIIGPEGGIDEREAVLARAKGAKTVSLGPRILRTETAGLVVIAIVMYQWADFGGPVA